MLNVRAGLILLVSAVLFLGTAPAVHSQDMFSQIDQVRKDVSQLRDEVRDLRNLVYELRKVVLESVVIPENQQAEAKAPKQEAAPKQKPAKEFSEQELTRVICKEVGVFFNEVDEAFRSSPDAAETKMRAAINKLNSKLQPYSGTHRVSKIQNIYEGLAWDAASAVRLRGSVAGNQDFRAVLQKHRQRYLDTCPRE